MRDPHRRHPLRRRCARRRRINHRYRDDYRCDHESGHDGCGVIVQVRYRNSQNNNNLFLISHFYFIPYVGNTDPHPLHRIEKWGRRGRSMEPVITGDQYGRSEFAMRSNRDTVVGNSSRASLRWINRKRRW